ncbi:MAG: ribonuclease III [Magnetococcales bacterium]|nr:ribonuclease III [Magnetococcales bacterium]
MLEEEHEEWRESVAIWSREALGYSFIQPMLLEEALTHRSHPGEKGLYNERLEFLGDAVLELLISRVLFFHFPQAREGELSARRADLVNTRILSQCGQELGLGAILRMGQGEVRSGGREKSSLLANGVEALLGAVYLDGGLREAEGVVHRILGWAIDNLEGTVLPKDFKSNLQERLQGAGKPLPVYQVVSTAGDPHSREFLVECRVEGEAPKHGKGRSKRAAEQESAREMLAALDQALTDKDS